MSTAYTVRVPGPLYRNTFVSPRTRDLVVPNIEVSNIQSIEGGYLLRSPKLKARFTVYLTDFKNETENIFASAWSVGRVLGELDLGSLGFGDDDTSLEQPIFFGATILQGVDRRHAALKRPSRPNRCQVGCLLPPRIWANTFTPTARN